MDFVTALPWSPKGNNVVWVIIDRLTKSAHFIPFGLGQSTELLAARYLHEVVHCKVCQSASYPTEIPDFYLTFGEVFKRAWGHD